MAVVWGIVVIVTSIVCWGGQVVSVVAPERAARLGLADSHDDVDRTFWLDGRGEAAWDLCSLWVMPVAGVLLVVGHDWWSYFGLIGGGAYVYFAGRGIFVRTVLRRHDVRIGDVETVRVALAALAVWGTVGLVTIGAALAALEPA